MSQEAQRALQPANGFSTKAFGHGLLAGLFLIAALAVGLQLDASRIIKLQQAKLASETVPVEKAAKQAIAIEPAPTLASAAQQPAAPVPEQPVALAPAPIAGLYEDTPAGRLPVIDKKTGLTPFQAYRRPFDATGVAGKPVISLVVTDLGLSAAAARTAISDLPGQVSFALSPYASTPETLITDARAKGHEIWLTLPMQTKSYPRADPGPYTLLNSVPQQENLDKLTWLMARGVGYVGFLGSYDPDFMSSTLDSKPVLDSIYARGLAFADTSEQPQPASANQDARYTHADIWLDKTVTESDIRAKLKELEDTATKNGHAVGIFQPLPLSYQQVQVWIATLPQKGYVLAPLSAQAAH